GTALDRFLPKAAIPDNAASTAVAEADRAAAPAPEAESAPEPSIAVLPFVNMSGDADNEYFSDGLTEELLNTLVRIGGLNVSGRTSSFAFKGKNVDMREIGKALNVANLLEGSVRKAGDRIRITAQLRLARHLRRFGFEFQQAGDVVSYHGQRAAFYISRDVLFRHLDADMYGLLEGIRHDLAATSGT
ncbi:MAG: hypothetical protein P8124_09410, partial [Gammaproteobacteria bacterium]